MRSFSEAMGNLELLAGNPYPGRGMVLGMDHEGKHLVQVYWIMGRSTDSRNRILVHNNGTVATEVADPSKLTNPDTSLIIYNAMRESEEDEDDKVYAVSNGHQTNDAVLERGCTFETTMESWRYEPDAPNYTSRITGLHQPDALVTIMQLTIIRKGPDKGCERILFQYDSLTPGFGHCITTYEGDGDPLPPFRGEPLLMPLSGNIAEIGSKYWRRLDSKNRVSLAVKFIRLETRKSEVHIINKYEKVG